MRKFVVEEGLVMPLDRTNVDTDFIIPKQFLKSIKRSGFGVNLFDEHRYLDKGEPDSDNTQRPINSDFVLNQPRYQGSQILLARDNFGCGSSREHAPWALDDYGFRAILAPSFADIFFNNCFKNGMLPIVLPVEQVEILMNDSEKGSNARIEVDLEAQTIISADGKVFSFEVDPFKKHCLLNGLDDIGLTMEKSSSIDAFEKKLEIEQPWL
jgi:3-isopropylmalate/(R)-2-methylmalate dehydratase small subunit